MNPLLAPWLSNIIILLYMLVVASCIVVVLKENRNPIRSLAWVIALMFLPVVGLVFYLFFGQSLKGRHMISRHNKRKLMHASRVRPANLKTLPLSPEQKQLVKLTHNLCRAQLALNNNITIFSSGKEKFDALKRDLKGARSSIMLQYYIFNDDSLGREIADILIAKARQGVDVKVIYDHVGSFSASSSFFRRMKDAGVDTHPFFRVTFPQLANRINWRNHRKIAVIDGAVGYIGGMNIADRYVNTVGEVWRDTHFRVEGDIVEQLMFSFAIDWNFMKKIPLFTPPQVASSNLSNAVGMQLATSGPMSDYNKLSMIFLKAISSAKKSIYIQTPYFLPTEALLHALETAALAKVDVRVMMPLKSDSRMLSFASCSYVTQCLQAGIKVYLYRPGMLHAKTMIIDDDIVTAGSTNFDFRSFENNFESNIIVYDPDFNRRMRNIFFADLDQCYKPSLTEWRRRPRFQRLLESVIRLFAPIL